VSELSRRRALGIAAGASAGALVPSWASAKGKPPRKPPKPRPPIARSFSDGVGLRDYSMVVGTQAPSEERFPGDPGDGKVLTGGSLFTGTLGEPDGVADLNDLTGVNHLLSRRFSSNIWSRSAITSDWNAGRIPFPSFKLGPLNSSTYPAALAGGRDADIAAEAQWCVNTFPGYLHTTFFHEPESDHTTAAMSQNFRDMSRRVFDIFQDEGATNVVWSFPVSRGAYSYATGGNSAEGQGGLKWWHFDPDWKGTLSGTGGTRPNASDWWSGGDSVVQLHGMDMYNPWVGGTGWRWFDDEWDTIKNRMISDGREIKPWTIPEFGTGVTSAYSSPPGGVQPDEADWTEWYQRAFQCMRDEDGVGFMTYHVDGERNLTNGGNDAPLRLAGYINALESESSYLVTVRP
jgi:hypothetical protein